MGDVDAKMGSIGRTKEELNDVQVNRSHSHFVDGEDDQDEIDGKVGWRWRRRQ